ncbi:MAG: discoidin domain-containing protein [Phycisphaerales bacterium]|nr:discoidin domain-containing protein [Phycisphaerales bacterium]
MKTSIIVRAGGLIALALPFTNIANAQNLAFNRPVTGNTFYDSGSETFTWQNVTDGQYNDTGIPGDWSFWLTPNNTGGFFTVDLGDLFSVTSFTLQNTHNRGFNDRATRDYTISLSTDGTNFFPVASGTLEFFTSSFNPIPTVAVNIDPTIGRYVRFTANSWYGASAGLNEIEVYGQPIPTPAAAAVLALGALTTSRRRRV